MAEPLHVGLDIGTSCVRAIAIDRTGRILALATRTMPPPERHADGGITQCPGLWRNAALAALREIARICPGDVRAIAVDGTSGTLLLTDVAGRPLGPARMYN